MASEFKIGRRPDFDVSVLNKDTDLRGKVGVAWDNRDGTISIRLNPFVVLSAAQPLVITLFPVDKEAKKGDMKEDETEVPT